MSVGRQTRLREMMRWLGYGYLGYHILAATLILFWFFADTRSGYRARAGRAIGIDLDDFSLTHWLFLRSSCVEDPTIVVGVL